MLALAAPLGAAMVTLAALPGTASAAAGDAALTGSAGRVTAVIPSTTRAVSAADIGSVARHGSTETITLGTAARVKAGDIVIAGIGKATPDGLIAKVTKVSGKKLTAKPATLRQAVPRGSFSAVARFGPVSSGGIAVNLPCGAGGGVIPVQGRATMKIRPVISASWTAKSVRVTVSAKASGTAEASAKLPPKYTCSPGPRYAGATRKLAPVQVMVGSVPVVVTPTLRWFVRGAAKTTQFISADVTQKFSMSAALTDNGGRYSAHGGASASAANKFTPSGPPSKNLVNVAIGAKVTMGLFGHSGPAVSIALGSKLSTAPDSSPWWTADATQQAAGTAATPDLALGSRTKTMASHQAVAAHGPAPKAGFSVYQTFGAQQGAVRGPGNQIWMISYFPPAQQGPAPGSEALAVVNPTTMAITFYGPLVPYIGSKTAPTLLAYNNGAPAFDGSGHGWLIATATAPSGAVSYRLVRYTPGPSKTSMHSLPSSCAVPEGLTSAGDGSVWLRCGSTTSNAVSKVIRVTSSGSMRQYGVSGTASIGRFAAGPGGSMWAVAYGAFGQSTGLVRFTSSGRKSFFRSPRGVVPQGVAGNGSRRLIETARCGSKACYESVSASGRLTRVATAPGNANSVLQTYGPAMDPRGDVWTLVDGPVAKSGEYFLELTPGNKTRVRAFSVPGGCGGSLLSVAGNLAASPDGSVWAESNSNCTFVGHTSTAYAGGLVRFRP